MKYLIVIAALFLFSCSAEKRLANLIKNHPNLLKKDTVYRLDTIIINQSKLDTFFSFDTLVKHDSIIFENKTVKIDVRYKDKLIYLDAECKKDTVYIKVPIITEKITVDKKTNYLDYLYIIAVILGIIFFYKLIFK